MTPVAICEFCSQLFVDLGIFSTAQFAINLEIEKTDKKMLTVKRTKAARISAQ
jgi:hypothetical protein